MTQTDADSKVKSWHIVPETNPPDYVEKTSRYLESCAAPDRFPEVDSDSGESLFITQKPVPEAVRSGRRRRDSQWSDPQESGDDSSSSASSGKTDTKRRRKKYTLPRFGFPFLVGRKSKPRDTRLLDHQNRSLHNATMGGFFKCVKELWQDSPREHDDEPTVYIEGGDISPLSEEEEERSENEDIKVVDRKHFVAPLKAKKRHSWCSQSKQKRKREKEEPSQGGPSNASQKRPHEASVWRLTPSSLDAESSDCREPSCRVVIQRERNEDGTPKTKRHLARGNEITLSQHETSEDELCSGSDATVCETHNSDMGGREASAAAEPRPNVSHKDDLPQTEDEPEKQRLPHSLPDLFSDTDNGRETSVKKRKKNKRDHKTIEEEEKDHSQEEPKGRTKRKKRTQQSSSTGRGQNGEEGVDVSLSSDAVKLEEYTGMSLKKKKIISDAHDAPKPTEGLDDQNIELVMKKKKKKKKRSHEMYGRNSSEDCVAQSDDSLQKTRTSSFLTADAKEKDAPRHGEQKSFSNSVDVDVWVAENHSVSARDFETESAEITGYLEKLNDTVRKKKGKRKVSVEQGSVEIDHERDFEEPSQTHLNTLPETSDTEVKRKKKRKGNKSELVTPVERLESAADLLTEEYPVHKKKKKKKKWNDEPC